MDLMNLLDPVENKDPISVPSRKAIVWGHDDLLTQAMKFFLEEEETLQVIQIYEEQGIDFLVEQTMQIKPEVVILHPGTCTAQNDLLIRLFQTQSTAKVITVSLENNLMQVFCKQSITLRHVSDLLSVVENRQFSENLVVKEVNPDTTDQ